MIKAGPGSTNLLIGVAIVIKVFDTEVVVIDAVDEHLPPGRGLEGSIQPIHKCFEFAKEWYAHHDDPNWIKWTAKDAMEMFQRHGLVGEIWKLPSSQNQF